MTDKRDTTLNISESSYLSQLKDRAIRSDPFNMLKESMPGRQHKPIVEADPAVPEIDEKDKKDKEKATDKDE